MLAAKSWIPLAAAVAVASTAAIVEAQSQNASCIPLTGSTMCPSFANSSISPANLAPAYPFFSSVSDVASFDSAFQRYFTNYEQFRQTKMHTGLQCNETGSLNATLQWAQTVLCGQFTSFSYNAGCTQNVVNASTSLVCRDTCTQYSESEYSFVSNASYCTPTNRLRPTNLADIRNTTLTNDHDQCTSWTAMYSANDTECVQGYTNEPNCGWGPGTSDQLCSYCSPGSGTLATCCYDEKTDLSGCAARGYQAAALVRPTTSIGPGFAQSTSSPAASSANSNGGGHKLSGGQLAGIIVGCILGALLIGALLAWLLFLCCCGGAARKRRQDETEAQSDRQGMLGGAASAATTSPREKAFNLSEDTNRNPSMSNEKVPMGMGGPAGAGGPGAGTYAAGGAAAGALAAGGLAAAGAGNRGSHNDGSANSRPLSTATTGTDGRGTTVPSVRCQYTGQEIVPGDTVVAIYPYSAGLSDELDLTPETREELHVVRIYDDGWCLLRRDNGKEGAAPLVCCQSSKGELPAHMRLGDSTGTGTGSGTGSGDETGMTSGAEGGMTSSVGGAVTADEHGFTSDAASR